MTDIKNLSLGELLRPEGLPCGCGMEHATELRYLKIGPGTVACLPDALAVCGAKKPFFVFDRNTHAAAWPFLEPVLREAGIAYSQYIFLGEHVEPNEFAMGSLTMAFDPSCDVIVAVGTGVINDCSKVLAHAVGLQSIVVGTAPSMDGFASNSSAMIENGLKVSLYNKSPIAVICDTDIMKNAPMRLLWAGLGDMLAKYISICEWRISAIVVGDPYCESVAALVRRSLKKVVDNADALIERSPEAIAAVAEGLVLSGICMGFMKNSRPASGLEHYFSHMWEMMALARGERADLHGIQVGVGTFLTFRLYEHIRGLQPSREKAENHVRSFDRQGWEAQTQRIFGVIADQIFEIERACGRNSPDTHQVRLNKLLSNWDQIQAIIEEELPSFEWLDSLMTRVGMPKLPEDLGVAPSDVYDAFIAARDVRDKYLSCSMLWDLGELGHFADQYLGYSR